VRRRAALGHIFAAALIVLIVLITATIIAGTMLQTRAGLSFAVGQVVGPIAEFPRARRHRHRATATPAARRVRRRRHVAVALLSAG
jgi:hypothetical protein